VETDMAAAFATTPEEPDVNEFFGDSHTNPIVHDGVEIGGDEASLIYYCHKGRWLELAGND
jgi:hypothetical protein